ncbi:MAG: MucR family transcriptional regulator [Sporichthyaceae bacterium]|nr:MucR family transcriptional regulator [Sporichthyaceae bacterium]
MRAPTPPDLRRAAQPVRVGVQPVDGGHLQCLDCGRWYRALGHHLAKAHHTSTADYRRRHELPAGLPLLAADLRAGWARRARSQYPTNTGLHHAQEPQLARAALRLAHRARAESGQRTGARLAQQQQLAARSAEVRAATRARYDQAARALGHPSIDALLAATRLQPARHLAAMLRVSKSTAGRLRQLYAPEPDPETRRAQVVRALTRARHDQLAQRAGHPDATALYAATRGQPDIVVARLLGVSVQTANRIRRAQPSDPS